MRILESLVLASASPRRLELLCSLGIRVRVVPSEIDEGDRPGHAPRELAVVLAAEKAAAVAPGVPDALVVAADTVVELDGRSLGKPRDPEEARAMLVALGGREHLVHSAYALRDGPSRRRLDGVATTRVRFAPLESAALDAYVASGDPFDKAGGYGIQGRGAALVERIDGDFYTVMGFPLGEFIRRLPALGYVLPETPR